MQQRQFTKEFEEEAVRLVQTSGRTQREIAGDLGTLVRWIGRSRDRRAADPATAAESDVTAELKRLRRENEILRQERDILKRPPLFSPGREVDEVRAHRSGEGGIPDPSSVPRAYCQPKQLLCLERSASAPPTATTLGRSFTATGPDEKWGADISYVWTRQGRRYLAVVIDLFARRVVGWATGDRLHRDLALAALRKALAMRLRQPG
jgi:transposase